MRDEIEKVFLYVCLTIRVFQVRKYNRFQLKLELVIYKKNYDFLKFFEYSLTYLLYLKLNCEIVSFSEKNISPISIPVT
jgi:hypothetical protein